MTTNSIKMFVGRTAKGLEAKVDTWFVGEGRGADVQNITTSVGQGKAGTAPIITVTVWYKKKRIARNMLRQLRGRFLS